MDLTIIALALVLILVALAAKYYGIIPPVSGSARVVIVISNRTVRVKRGVLNPDARLHLQGLVEQFAIGRATIGLTSSRRVIFSMSVPAKARQPIRNVLLNV
jgi:hypothetical protein